MTSRRTAEGLRIGQVFGIDLVIDASWLVIAALVTWALQLELDNAHPEAGGQLWLLAGASAVAFFGSVLVHELAHSVVARARGAEVLRIRLFIFGGISEIASEVEDPADEFWVTIVGPFSSALVGALFLAAAWLLPTGPVATSVRILGTVNLALAIFNLLPGFPLDGGRILRSIVWRASGDYAKATRIAVWAGQAMGIILMLLGAVLIVAFRQPGGFWYLAIGWFLYRAAADALTQSILHGGLATKPVGELALRGVPTVDRRSSVAAASSMMGDGDVVLVLGDGRVVGVLDEQRCELVPIERWPEVEVGSVMVPVTPDDVIDARVPLARVAPGLDRRRRFVVVDDGRAVGVLSRRSLEERVRLIRRGE